MNRRQKIIVSITGIFLVLLILVGLTYGYFLTRIQGNTNDTSMRLTTANLRLVYGDGQTNIIEQENITPGTTIGTKDFTVTNEGDGETEYVVVIDGIKITKKLDGNTATFESNDFVYTLTCTSSVEGNTCNGVSEETTLPLINDGILVGNTIAKDEVQTYNITVKYKETGLDQSNDMGKKLEAKVDIKNFKEVNPYEEGTLAYNIIDNAKNNTNGTELKMTPETKPLEQISTENERELLITSDDYGTTYYYRGNIEDNYVQFAGMCWRIVRIQGDGSIKLVLASEEECNSTNVTTSSGYAKDDKNSIITTHYGYKMVGSKYINDYINSTASSSSGARVKLNEWLGRKITDDSLDKLKIENWCIGDLTTAYSYSDTGEIVGTVDDLINKGTSFEYTAGNRYYYFKSPKIKCETTGTDGEIDENKIGMLTMDEVAFAGGGKSGNSNYYLNKNATSNYWWTLSPSRFNGSGDSAFNVGGAGNIHSSLVDNDFRGLRPAVSLASDSRISSGDGTLERPYIIE